MIENIITPDKFGKRILTPEDIVNLNPEKLYNEILNLSEEELIKGLNEHSIVNAASTFSNFLNVNNGNSQINSLKEALNKKNYKNIIFINLDGFGPRVLNATTDKNNILRQGLFDVLFSTMPPATVPATNSLMYGKFPTERGWPGWSAPIDEKNTIAKIFMNRNFYTGENVPSYPYGIPTTPYINAFYVNRKTFAVVPSYHKNFIDGKSKLIPYKDSFDNAVKIINEICQGSEQKFIYVYCDQPDKTSHLQGIDSKETKTCVENLSAGINNIVSNNDDTLIIIISDHDMSNIKEDIKIYDNANILELLESPESMWCENRFTVFKTKNGQLEQFKENFKRDYGTLFRLLRTTDMIQKGYFGRIIQESYRLDLKHLYGDVVAIATSDKTLKFYPEQDKNPIVAHHSGLPEVLSSLCVIESER